MFEKFNLRQSCSLLLKRKRKEEKENEARRKYNFTLRVSIHVKKKERKRERKMESRFDEARSNDSHDPCYVSSSTMISALVDKYWRR